MAAFLQGLIKRHETDHPTTSREPGSQGSPTNACTSGKDWLAFETGTPVRTLYRAMHESEGELITLALADRILSKAGYQHVLGGPDVPVIPNPRLTPEEYREAMLKRGCVVDE